MLAIKAGRILSIGDKYMNGTIINIEKWDDGFMLTIRYKTVPNKKILIYLP